MFVWIIIERRGVTMRMVAHAAAVILIVKHKSLLGPSFQMSFAGAIVGPASASASDRGGRAALYVFGVTFTTLLATTAPAPFVVFHFNQFSHYSLVANVAAVPITSLWIMPMAVAAFAMMPFVLRRLRLCSWG